ncbi:beta-glucosidase BglX [Polaribacter sp. BAL334]|uniref:beta-glucosidase BglX n=1 Tax=Polaribacter sp. BAL334 TaxID=1708178 RepID=UPI0018D23E6F|nr:beta-glucosidase BglX [Polaribacter sp. BAL334]MBG7611223.1 beta-glucosidase BglX [Polaribacter sp. BAL334]
MKNYTTLFKILVLLTVIISCESSTGKKSKIAIDKKVDSLLRLMTLEEKIGQMNQYTGFFDPTGPSPKAGSDATKYKHIEQGLVGSMLNVKSAEAVLEIQKIAVEKTRLGIPLIFALDVIHGQKTLAPVPLAESASWDLKAIEQSARNAAIESSAQGINWTFAPMVDISRDARWGRVMEGAGEDTYLGSLIATARVKGFQGDDLSAHNTIAACAKHFVAYGFAESGREYNTVDVGTSTLHNFILPPFKAAADAGVKTFMNSFNDLNGIPATANTYLQRELLKKEWNFDGFVVSDWGTIAELVAHTYAKDLEEATKMAVLAGNDMDMQSFAYVKHLANLVKDGQVDEVLVDEAAGRILKVKFELGLFNDPYKYCDLEREKEVLGNKKLHADALDIAKKSIVLLKNEGQLLPLKKEGLDILVVGELANDKTSPLGNWRVASKDGTAISVLEGLNTYTNNRISYQPGPKVFEGKPNSRDEIKINTSDRTGIKKAVNAAKNKDVVLMVLGEHGLQSGEGRSRTNLDLPGLQQELLEAVYKVNKNIVLVLMNGRPLAINWADEHLPAIVEAWQLGTQSGNAIAEVLYGDYNPSGKLTMSFPKNVGQVPIYYNHKTTGRPVLKKGKGVYWSHYSDVDNEPLYEFGFGLSYTSFSYEDIKLSTNYLSKDSAIQVSCTLKNTGNYTGKEVVQMYIQDLVGSTTRPVRELKGFEMVTLKPGESKEVSFTIDKETIQYYTVNNKWEAEPGDFKVYIGGSSNASLSASFNLAE